MIKLNQDEENALYVQALEGAGVDNWEWYGEAMETFNKEKRDALVEINSMALVDMFSTFIADNTTLKEVDGLDHVEPTYSKEEAAAFINKLLEEKKKIEAEIEAEVE